EVPMAEQAGFSGREDRQRLRVHGAGPRPGRIRLVARRLTSCRRFGENVVEEERGQLGDAQQVDTVRLRQAQYLRGGRQELRLGQLAGAAFVAAAVRHPAAGWQSESHAALPAAIEEAHEAER